MRIHILVQKLRERGSKYRIFFVLILHSMAKLLTLRILVFSYTRRTQITVDGATDQMTPPSLVYLCTC